MLLAILKKELKRVFSDKRLVFSLFILPALSIFIIYSIMGKLSSSMVDDIEQHTPIVYVQNSSESFKDFYNNVTLENEINLNFVQNNDTDSIKNSILNGDVDLLIVFNDEFDTDVVNYKTRDTLPEIKTYYNPSEEYSRSARDLFVNDVLNQYEKSILTKRYTNINYVKAFAIDSTNKDSKVVNKNKEKGKLLSRILPMLIGLILFSSTIGVGTDAIAGEKERGTMANLLLTPVKRKTIAYGKMAGLAIIAVISALCSFVGIALSVPFSSSFMPVGGGLPQFTIMQYIQLLLIMITMVGINVGLICLISVKSKSVKEATTYITPVYMLVMLASFSSMFGNGTLQTYKYAIPIYGGIASIKAILNFELSMQGFIFTILASVITTLILTKAITSSFNNEKIMFDA